MPEVSVRQVVFNLCIDLVVLANAVVVSFEVDANGDNETMFAVVRSAFCLIYIAEMVIQLLAFRECPKVQLIIVLVASVAAFALTGDLKKLWRVTVLRLFRYLRIWQEAAKHSSLRDLWIVLVGLAHAAKAILWLHVVLAGCIYACAGAATGMALLSLDQPGACSESVDGYCLDTELYFGSILKSGLTLFQCITLDGWAGQVVRPLWHINPIMAVCITAFSVVIAYAMVSVAIGVLVFSTVNLARKHLCHDSMVEMARDFEIVRWLRRYFERTLEFDQRNTIGHREFNDAMSVKHVENAIKRLDLPVADNEQLFQHLARDSGNEMTPAEFQKRMETILRPANRFDIACLTAGIGGSVTHVHRMDKRTDELINDLRGLKVRMRRSFSELNQMTRTGQESGDVPEVVLRQAGRIFNPIPPGPPRFTR